MTFVEHQHPRSKVGAFVDKEQSRPDVWLSTSKPSSKVLADIDFAAGIRSADPRVARAAAAGLFAQARDLVADHGSRRGLSDADVQDAIGEALDSLNDYVRKGEAIQRGLVLARSATVISQFVHGPSRHESVKAMKALHARTEKFEADTGRLATDKEIDGLAEEVRDAWPDPRHRPVKDFQNETKLRTPIAADTDELAKLEQLGLTAHAPDTEEADTRRLRFEELTDSRPGKRKQYETWASARDLPSPARKTIRSEHAERLTAEYADSICEIANRHLDGQATSREQAALFAPFGALTTQQRMDLAAALTDQPAFAGRLWASAVSSAAVPAQRAKVAA